MIIIALFAGCFVYFFIMMILYNFGERLDHAQTRINSISDMYLDKEKVENELNKPFKQRFLKPFLSKVLNSLSNFMPQPKSKNLKKMLATAGYYLTPRDYSAIRLIVMISVGITLIIIASLLMLNIFMVFFLGLMGMILGLIVMKYRLLVKMRLRKEDMRSQMPEVLDLLYVSVEAGLGFDAALIHVTNSLKGPLIEELDTTQKQIKLGKQRRDALRELGERTALEEMLSFTSAVIQAEQLGISLNNVLTTQSHQIRTNRRHIIEEKAMKAPVKIIIPLVLFIFPVILIILLAPAIINIVNIMGGLT